jgi:hypothetical protein
MRKIKINQDDSNVQMIEQHLQIIFFAFCAFSIKGEEYD